MFDQLKQSFVNKFAIVFSSGWLENLKKKSVSELVVGSGEQNKCSQRLP